MERDFPLPRKSYYTEDYCRKHKRRFRTTVELAAAMLRELRVPDDVDVVVDLRQCLRCRRDPQASAENAVFARFVPLDPNRVLARTPAQDAAWLSGEKVVAWTRQWSRQQFALLELAMDNEDHVFARRRHADNLRVKKTKRRYAAAARPATVSKLGDCLIVASYKENPKVQLLPGQSAEWWAYHQSSGFVSPAKIATNRRAGTGRCWPVPIRPQRRAKWSNGTKSVGR